MSIIKDLPINITEESIGFFDLGEIVDSLIILRDNYDTHAMNSYAESYNKGRKDMLSDLITYFNKVIGVQNDR